MGEDWQAGKETKARSLPPFMEAFLCTALRDPFYRSKDNRVKLTRWGHLRESWTRDTCKHLMQEGDFHRTWEQARCESV